MVMTILLQNSFSRAKWLERWPQMYAKPDCVPLVPSSTHIRGPLVLAGVGLSTINIDRVASSATRLGYQRWSGLGTVTEKTPWDLSTRTGEFPQFRVFRHFFVQRPV